jgi:nucleoside-diphosphate-sugar epimerase
MGKRILITGGAGFSGSHLAADLLAHDHQVRVLDVLSPQVHGTRGERPDYLHPDNVFGPRQAPSNPYTGVLAIFAARYLNDQPPSIFEAGFQQGDFVSVYDYVRLCQARGGTRGQRLAAAEVG